MMEGVVLKLTTFGAGQLLDYMLRRISFPVWDGLLNVALLYEAPPTNPDLSDLADFPVALSQVDPPSYEIPTTRWAPAIPEDGQAVIVTDHPAFHFEVIENFTVFGVAMYNEFAQVLWSDRFTTPEPVTAGGVYQLYVAVVLTDHCDLS